METKGAFAPSCVRIQTQYKLRRGALSCKLFLLLDMVTTLREAHVARTSRKRLTMDSLFRVGSPSKIEIPTRSGFIFPQERAGRS
jgi:hypothetical protein